MNRPIAGVLALSTLLFIPSCGPAPGPTSEGPADLILSNGAVYTMEEDHPWASTVVITGNMITAVLDDDAAADRYRGPDTRVIDLEGKFVVPGFIDGHVHFNGAGGLINDANLMAVADDDGADDDCDGAADEDYVVPEAATDLRFDTTTVLSWSPTPDAQGYNAYRGDFSAASWTYDHTCLQPNLPGPSVTDGAEPAVGTGFYYLISALTDCGEGGLGSGQGTGERPVPEACP